jgi:hypothetical protein
VIVTAASIQDRDAAHRVLAVLRGAYSTITLVWATAATQDGWSGGRNSFSPFGLRSSNGSPGSTGFHVRPHVWVVERSFA